MQIVSKQSLPLFRYHPDPFATRSASLSDAACSCCGQVRGHTYTAGVYCLGPRPDHLCLWCIADGSAHVKYNATFNDDDPLLREQKVPIPRHTIDEVTKRTPGFVSWQDGRWWTHCGDAGAFVGSFDLDYYTASDEASLPDLRKKAPLDDDEWKIMLESWRSGRELVAIYLFRCLHCGLTGGYHDTD